MIFFSMPFYKNLVFDIGYFYIPLILVIVATHKFNRWARWIIQFRYIGNFNFIFITFVGNLFYRLAS